MHTLKYWFQLSQKKSLACTEVLVKILIKPSNHSLLISNEINNIDVDLFKVTKDHKSLCVKYFIIIVQLTVVVIWRQYHSSAPYLCRS